MELALIGGISLCVTTSMKLGITLLATQTTFASLG
jgi:hypothetical protein